MVFCWNNCFLLQFEEGEGMMNKRFLNLISVFIKETFRDKLDVFFTLFFPVFFLIIFGTIFISPQDSVEKERLYVFGIYGNYIEDVEKYFEPHEVIFYESLETLKNDIESRKLSSGIEFIEKNDVKVYSNESFNEARESINVGMVIENAVKKYAIGAKRDYFNVNNQLEGLGRVVGTDIDYLLTGVLSLSILSGGMFSIIGVFGRYKREGIIKRFMVTPAKPWEFVVSSSFTKVLLNLVSIFIIVLLARLFFNANLDFNWITFLLVCISSTIGMMGLGVLILIIFKKTEASYTASSVLYTIMTFFSGIYFPVQFLPSQVRWISHILPVTYLTDVLRYVSGIEDMSFIKFITINLVFIFAGIILLYTASKIYVTSEKNITT